MTTILGFPVPAPGTDIGTYLVPGTTVKLTLRKDVAPLLLAVARDFDREVEGLKAGQCGGFNPRKIAGSNAWSRHALGCAIDLNWTAHPMGRSGTFNAAKQTAIRKILGRYTYGGKQIIRWGGTFSRPDDMHFELNAERTAALAAVRALQTPPKPPAAGTHKPGTRILKVTSPVMRGPDVAWAQRWVGAADDGIYGNATKARVGRYQAIVGVPQSGRVDGPTWSKMLGRTIRL